MRHAVFAAIAVVGLLTTGALAQDASVPPALPTNVIFLPGQPTDLTNAPNGDDTTVCNYQRETGSLLITRVCRTLRAWKAMQRDAKEFMGFGFRGAHQCGEGGCSSKGFRGGSGT